VQLAKKLLLVAAFAALPLQAQETNSGITRITLENEDGEPVVITVDGGSVAINGNSVFEFDATSDLGSIMSAVLRAGAEGSSGDELDLSAFINGALSAKDLADLEPAIAKSVNERVNFERIRSRAGTRMESIEALGIPLENAMVHSGDLTVKAGDRIDGDVFVIDGDANIFGHVNGTVVVLDGDVRVFETGWVDGDAITIGGGIPVTEGAIIGETVRRDAAPQAELNSISITAPSGPSLVQIFAGLVAMLGMAFGVAHFFPEPFDILSNTISDASGKSLLAGAFSLPLIPLALAITFVGLALTVVGILVIPFAFMGAVAFLGLTFCAGYLACARALGRAYTERQRRNAPHLDSGPFRNTLYGLVGLMSAWVPAALLGWVPVVGQLALALAWAVTLAAITTGWGAAVLARQELRAALINAPRRSLTGEFPVVAGGR
jgi:hypothetical protein